MFMLSGSWAISDGVAMQGSIFAVDYDDETAAAPSPPQSTTAYDKRPEEGDPAGSKLDEKL